MQVQKRQEQWIEDFLFLPDVQSRLESLMLRSLNHEILPPDERQDSLRVNGCVSAVWVKGELQDGRCFFQMAADSTLVAALVGWLCDLYQGGFPEEVYAVEPEIWEKLGFDRYLSPTRLRGLSAVREKIRSFAKKYRVNEGRNVLS